MESQRTEKSLEEAVAEYIKAVGESFAQDTYRRMVGKIVRNDHAQWQLDRAAEFKANVKAVPGRNYIKITTSSGTQTFAHSFIVKKATKGFKVGDVLKTATWRAPATNFARGNVITGQYRAYWTGAC